MKHKPIKSLDEYKAVASRLEQLKDAPQGSDQARELRLLTRLIAEFEAARPIAGPEQSEMP